MMIVSTNAWAETVVLSSPSANGSVHSDADGIVTLTDKATKGGIQQGSVSTQGVTCMKLSGSREFVLTYSSDVTINSVKLYARSNGAEATTVGTNGDDKDSYGSTEAKTGDFTEFTLTGVNGEGLYFSGQSNAVIIVDYTASSTKTETGVAATGIKVNGAKVNGAAFDSDNTYTLTDSYVLPPTVAVIKTTSYSDSSTKNADVTVTFALNEDKSFHIGKVTIGETEYTIKVPVKALSTTLADVTGSTTWDWTKTGATAIQLSETTYPSKTDEFVLSNLIPSTDNFNSDALKVQTEYAVRDGKYFQGGKIMFHTTVPGTIKVTFSNTGNRNSEADSRWLYVNGEKTAYGSWKAEMLTTEAIEVEAGNVVLTSKIDGNEADQYIRVSKIEFTEGEAPGPEPTEWESYELVLNAAGLLTTEDMTKVDNAYPSISFGIALDAEGKAYRVAPDATNAIAVVSGKYHSDHGMNPFSMTAKVPGAVKITAGTCSFGTCQVKVNGNAAGEAVVGDGSTTCWKGNKDNIATGIYTGEAGEITITTGCYTPYIKIEKWNASIHTVTFAKGEVECEGTLLPEAKEVADGENMTIPANHTLYKEGYTLTGWTDGTNIYNVGTSFAPTAETTLTPVFTENTKSLADRTGDVTVKWDFQTQNGAPTLSYENEEGLIYVTQATVEEQTIDVKLDFSTKPGKVNNASWNDWCQMNSGTTFTIPSCKGAKVSIASMNATTTSTIDGQTDYTAAGGVVTAEIGNKADAIDIVIGDGSYFRYIQVVLPVVEAPAGKTKEADLINTDMSDLSAVSSGDANTQVITTTGSKEDITFTFHNTTVEPAYTNSKFTLTGAMVAQKNGQATITTSAFNNITKVTYVHGATGGSRGWGLKVKGDGDSDWVTLSDAFADPAGGATVAVDVNRKNVQLQWYNLADAQNAMMFNLNIKGNITVYGEEYEIAAQTNIAEAGSATIYPAGGTYTEGDEVTLTATENFGYDFVNWTNANGEEVSTEAKFKAEVTANETYTANFVQVNTYALNVTVEGGANDYMISYNPAPTVVENKNMYEADTKVTITAAENPILTFNSWSNGETSKEIEVTMNEDTDLTATFSAVDFIAGWDFYKAGNNGRNADFFAADNDAVSLVLRNEEGSTYGWLDKSQLAAGGYEGRPGAVNWKNDAAIGTYYWQTKVNAEAFTNLKVKTAMVYNYNAYQKYDVQASLNGTDWETIGSVNMTGAKAWADLEANFPATYDNQKEVYVRWIADKTSNIDGSSSANDGACLGATYITGTAKLIDDGTAPELVSTVPAKGADNASANGKIVLTFDEKVKVAEGAKATLGDMQLTPVVSGKTVTFEYKQLKYATAYTFSLPANSVSDLTDNAIAEAITINFQTKQKPTIEKGLYDVIVRSGEEMKAAIAQANSRADKSKRFRIFVMPGSHKIPVYDTKVTVEVELANGTKEPRTYDEPRTYITGDNISIIGADYETTTITNSTPTETFTGRFGDANISEGIGNNDVFQISAKNTYFQGVTVKTGIGDALGRDIAIQDKGDKTIIKDARLWGYQDTYTNNANGRFYFEGGVVRGRTDYLCGKGDIWFEGVTLQQCGQGGYPIVPSQPRKYGWIFNECTLTPETSDVTCTLGRPWGSGTPIALLINTVMEVVPGAEGWSEMSGGWPARFAEYNSTTKTGTVIDLSQRKKTFGNEEKGIHENCNNPVLTAEEAAEYSIAKVMGDGDDWDPTAYTEQASAPENVTLSGTSLTWDDSNYIFCWAVIKDGEIVDFTITPEYTVDDASATWSVRAANEMGGLGEATEATLATGINSINKVAKTSDAIFNIAGQKVSKSYKGIMIKNGKKYVK